MQSAHQWHLRSLLCPWGYSAMSYHFGRLPNRQLVDKQGENHKDFHRQRSNFIPSIQISDERRRIWNHGSTQSVHQWRSRWEMGLQQTELWHHGGSESRMLQQKTTPTARRFTSSSAPQLCVKSAQRPPGGTITDSMATGFTASKESMYIHIQLALQRNTLLTHPPQSNCKLHTSSAPACFRTSLSPPASQQTS